MLGSSSKVAGKLRNTVLGPRDILVSGLEIDFPFLETKRMDFSTIPAETSFGTFCASQNNPTFAVMLRSRSKVAEKFRNGLLIVSTAFKPTLLKVELVLEVKMSDF